MGSHSGAAKLMDEDFWALDSQGAWSSASGMGASRGRRNMLTGRALSSRLLRGDFLTLAFEAATDEGGASQSDPLLKGHVPACRKLSEFIFH